MPAIKSPKNLFIQFLILIISIALSCWISTLVDLKVDELGALANIYLPYVVGLATVFVVLFTYISRPTDAFQSAALYLSVIINLITGSALNFNYNKLNVDRQLSHRVADPDITLVNSVQGKVILKNTGTYPFGKEAYFSYSYNPDLPPPDSINTNYNADVATFKLINLRSVILTITKANFNEQDLWDVHFKDKNNRITHLPVTVLPGDSIYIVVNFTANKLNNRAKTYWWKTALKLQNWIVSTGRKYNFQPDLGSTCSTIAGQLNLITNDDIDPVKAIQLNAIWEYRSENDWEPGLQTILNALNFKTKVGFKYFDNGLKGDRVTTASDEVSADYFQKADAGLPITITKIASYHGCCTTADADTLDLYYPRLNTIKQLQYTDQRSGQMLLPNSFKLESSSSTVDAGVPFAIKIGSSFTDRKKNFKNKIGIRVWKAIDQFGQALPNTYIIGSDYLGKRGTNYDYQDNVYLLQNVRRCRDSAILYSENNNLREMPGAKLQ